MKLLYSPAMFAACRMEYGTVMAMQNLMLAKGISEAETQLDLIFLVSDITSVHDFETMDHIDCFSATMNLINAFLDQKAKTEEMVVTN